VTTIAVGNYLKLTNKFQRVVYRFQNFHISQNAEYDGFTWSFLPFGFSGVSVNRNGDNTSASLVFPNNQLSRSWGAQAVTERWLANVLVMSLDPDDRTTGTMMHQYFGQVAAGDWDETSLQLDLNTVLDAVGADVPSRRLTQSLIGNIPVSSNVRLS
jgi:hypothetical protein